MKWDWDLIDVKLNGDKCANSKNLESHNSQPQYSYIYMNNPTLFKK